jgi:hypothetical protein
MVVVDCNRRCGILELSPLAKDFSLSLVQNARCRFSRRSDAQHSHSGIQCDRDESSGVNIGCSRQVSGWN